MAVKFYVVQRSIRMAHFDECSHLSFHLPLDYSERPELGEEIFVTDPDGCEAWGPVTEIDGDKIVFRPTVGAAP